MSEKGTRPDPDKVAAISQFPIPEDLTNLRSFLGLANQFSDFSPDLTHAMEPMKGLLSKKNAFVWNAAHKASMEDVKAIITGPQCLAHFNPKLKTTLLTDASRIEMLIPRFSVAIFRIVPADRWLGQKFVASKQDTTIKLKFEYILNI